MSEPAISLARYSQIVGYRDCAFWGVNSSADTDYACRRAWSQAERMEIDRYLREAQEELEREIRYFLAPSWVADEEHIYRYPLILRWGHIIEAGILSDTVLSAGEVPDYSGDPAIIGPVALGACPASDVHLYHAGTDVEITPSKTTVAGGNITFEVPLCRLVAETYWDNPEDGWDYADSATWRAATVDVRCRTTDPGTQASLLWRSAGNACRSCSGTTRTACVYIRRGELGIVDVTRATYAAGTWTPASTLCTCGCNPQWVRVSYRAGLQELGRQAEDAIVRLAHSKMPEEPCGCSVTQRLWKRDRNVPQTMTRERVNCPLGMSDGAWIAWRWAQVMRLVRGGRPL